MLRRACSVPEVYGHRLNACCGVGRHQCVHLPRTDEVDESRLDSNRDRRAAERCGRVRAVASDVSPKTVQKYVDNLWALGDQILGDRIDDEGGPLV